MPAKEPHSEVIEMPRRYTARGVDFAVKQVVVSPWMRTKLVKRGPRAFRAFVQVKELHPIGSGDLFVLFVELVGTPEAPAGCRPVVLATMHESDADSPTLRWSPGEIDAALEDVLRQVFKVPAEMPLERVKVDLETAHPDWGREEVCLRPRCW